MKVYDEYPVLGQITNPVVTIGTFDGVHLGHGKILTRLIQEAKAVQGETVVVTFEPHPRKVLFPHDESLKLLNTPAEKIRNFERNGVNNVVVIPFTKEFSRLTATDFIRDVLVNSIGVKQLVIGYDHHFGRNREGSIENLTEMATVFGFKVEEIPAQLIDEAAVSSTKIRNALLDGDVKTANSFLGYAYSFAGTVIKGAQLGRKLGFPTANVIVNNGDKLIPAKGVYLVNASVSGKLYKGVMNIGNKPTVAAFNPINIEVHLLDFDGEIYGEEVEVICLQRIRDEQKFDSLELLKQQIANDIETAQFLYTQQMV